jgi:hypothetical protein
MNSNFFPMPKSRPTTTLISKCPQRYTLSSHDKFYFPEVDISSTVTLEIMSFQNYSKTPLVLHHFQQHPILITRTLTFQCSGNLETKIYTTNILLTSVPKMNANKPLKTITKLENNKSKLTQVLSSTLEHQKMVFLEQTSTHYN